MKIAISDACIFIDLHNLELTAAFFGLPLDIHTSLDVFNELNTAQKKNLDAFIATGHLCIHNITETERIHILKAKFPSSLSVSDQTVLYLAQKHEAVILSSDKTIRHNAKIRSIEYHGMLWIFDQLVEAGLLNKNQAAHSLSSMITSNMIYQNNKELVSEMNKRLKKWN